jgi:putative ABC transport system permease protein
MLTLLRRLSARHLAKAPLRSGLVVLGIALGVAVVVATRATSAGMLASFDELVQRTAARADMSVVGNESGIPGELTAQLAGLPGVAHAAPALELSTSFASDGQPLLVLGVDFLGDTHFLPFKGEKEDDRIVEDPLAFANDPTALLITRTLASKRKLAVGDAVQVLGVDGPVTLHVRGILLDEGPAASFGGQVAVMFIDAAQVAFGRGTLVDRIDVALEDGVDAQEVTRAIEAALAGKARVELPEKNGERLRSLAAPLHDGLQLSGVVALLVGVFIIYNAVGIAVTQRRRETGVLRALGVLQRDVVLHFVLEATLLAALGIALGLLMSQHLLAITHTQTATAMSYVLVTKQEPPRIELADALIGAVAALLVTWAAAFWPALRGARLDPVEALRHGARTPRSSRLRPGRLGVLGIALMISAWVIAIVGRKSHITGYVATVIDLGGAALLAPIIVVVGRKLVVRGVQRAFGAAGRLGVDYVQRDLGRSTINVLALMIAVSLGIAVAGWLGSFEHSVRKWFEQVSATDLTITAGSPVIDRKRVLFSPSAMDKLEGMPGVAALQPMRLIQQRYGAFEFRLVASDTRPFLEQALKKDRSWRVIDGKSPIEPHELADGKHIVLGENAAHLLGKRAGEMIELESPTGIVQLKVRAVVIDYSSELGAGFIDRSLYVERWRDEALDLINVYLEPNADAAKVTEQVRERLGGGNALFVTGTSKLREQYLGLVNDSFAYARSLELIVLVIALLGVIGTMVSAVLDRTRELGMLRAIGATRAQIARTLVIEAAFIGVCAVVLGVFAGAIQSKMFLEILVAEQAGWRFDFVFPAQAALRLSILVVFTAALAGLLPGLRAARLDIKDALSRE